MLLSRYLGAKTELLPSILRIVDDICSPGDRILDAFSGSLAVSMALKQQGYEVAATDLNLLSHTFSQAYLIPTRPSDYAIDAKKLVGIDKIEAARVEVDTFAGLRGWKFLEDPDASRTYVHLLSMIKHLQEVQLTDLDSAHRKTHFFDAYSPEGAHAAFTSSRGRSGTRRFFTGENALRLDAMLNQLHTWRQHEVMSESALSLLTATVCHASEKVANTQGTWHDFPRETWDNRAFKPLTLQAPPLDGVFAAGRMRHDHGCERDVVGYVADLPPVKLAYFDPPYNFRQYTAYYHLPNLICRYPHLERPDRYFEDLDFVRGQNMSDDRPSEFCGVRSFVPAMRRLLSATPAQFVVLSYFTGRNHWSDFDTGPDDVGLQVLSELLTEDEFFVTGSLKVARVPRTNYASYGGFTARKVDELLLVAERRDPTRTDSLHDAERQTSLTKTAA